jgi:hypothetical protein
MNPTLATTILLAGAATAAAPQSPPPAFEVASIKRNSSGDTLRAPSLILPGGRFTATNNTLRALILNAYGISASPYLLSGGPGWIDSERYDVDAIGTYMTKFVVPNLNKEEKRIPTRSIVLSSQRVDLRDALYTAGKDKDQVSNPLVQDGQKLIPSLTRVFSRTRDL